MKGSLRLAALARWSLFAVAAATSLYCLLCYIPFSWKNFIQDHHYPLWVGFFLRAHVLFLGAALALAALTLSRWRWAFALASGAAALAVSWPLMSGRVGNDGWSLLLSMVCWLPLVSWETLRLLARPRALTWTDEPVAAALSARLPAALLAAGLVFAAFTAEHLMAHGTAWAGPSRWTAAFALGESLLSHIFAFLALFLCCDLARTMARLLPGGRVRDETLLLLAGLGAFAFWAIDSLLLGSLSFSGPAAWALAATGAWTAVLALLGQACDLAAARPEPVSDAVEFVTAPLAAFWRPTWRRLPGQLAGLLLLAASPWVLRLAISVDWDRIIATFGVLAIWAAAFVFFHGWLRQHPGGGADPGRRDLAAVLACLLLAWGADAALTGSSPRLRLTGISVAPAMHRLAEEELSLRTARRLFQHRSASGDFYGVLHANTNISRQTPIAPRELDLAGAPPGALARKPNIFIIVIDSLRPDYLGAYNPKADFTPAIDAFAKDSWVWRRAFTSYGATGLSEPSIWAGARLPHKQYVTPFAPMNSLERLTKEEGYHSLVAVDAILWELLERSPDLTPLGGQPPIALPMTCPTLTELSSKLALRGPGPVFSYLQAQDLHVSVIDREGGSAVDGKTYPGFDAPYASRVARVDACFGSFLASLERAGLYEDSIVVLAADHGDSLGEGGRRGHAYTIFPEILRVPLIMHVPERLRQGLVWDADSAAFLTDLTPTLYALLGRSPRTDGEVLGRSLVASSREELLRTARPERPVVSSYGPVYGLLKDDGRRLYIADGLNFTSYLFDLERDPAGEHNLITPEVEQDDNAAILRHIDALNAFYRFRP